MSQQPDDMSASVKHDLEQNILLDALAQAVLDRLQDRAQTQALADQVATRALELQRQEESLAAESLAAETLSVATAPPRDEVAPVHTVNMRAIKEPQSLSGLKQEKQDQDLSPSSSRVNRFDVTLLESAEQEENPAIEVSTDNGTGGAGSEEASLRRTRLLAQALTDRPYLYERVGYDQRSLVFCPDGTVGQGQGGREIYWDLVESSGVPSLEISSEQELTCRLFLGEDGAWTGIWLHGERMPIRVSPQTPLTTCEDSYLSMFLPASGHRPYLSAALRRLHELAPEHSIIVEIGSVRSATLAARDSDGWSTLALGWFAAMYGAELHTVDVSPANLNVCRQVVRPYNKHINFHVMDGEDFLLNSSMRIGMLYLDAWNNDRLMRQAQYRDAYRALSVKPTLILLHVADGEGSADLSRRALVQEAFGDGYVIVFQTTQHLLLQYTSSASPENLKQNSFSAESEPLADASLVQNSSRSDVFRSPFPLQQELFRAEKQHMLTQSYPMRVVTHDRGGFKSLSGANVLIYWPHGFGDWVFLSYLLPLFSPRNRYWVARFGDDSPAVFEDSSWASPLYLGTNSPHCDDGEGFGCRHFGLSYGTIDGDRQLLTLPLAMAEQCERLEIDTLLWSNHPEQHGNASFPYHTKGRYLLPFLADEARLAEAALDRPLPSAINFEVTPWLRRWVEARLRSLAGLGPNKLCVISRNGYTAAGKNWGHKWREEMPKGKQHEGEECRDFMRLLLRKDPRWTFLVMEDILFDGQSTLRSEDLNAYSYAQVFGSIGGATPPFGLVLKAIFSLADLVIGVPTGPYHMAMAKPGLPTVGLWTEHLPSWYDEPKADSRHLVGRHVVEQGYPARSGSFDSKEGLRFETRWLDTHIIPAQPVLDAVEDLMYAS